MRDVDLSEVLDSIDIEAWLDRQAIDYRTTRGARGVQLNVRECPVCGASSWKVYLNAETGLGNCFSGDCETKFNKWKFIQASIGAPAREIIEHLQVVAKEQGWRPKKVRDFAVDMAAGEVELPKSMPIPIKGRNLRYLGNRGITVDVARYFHLAFCHKGAFFYTDPDGRRRRQSYDNRIIIPVFDLDGDLVTFQGRDITGEAERKYLFPPGLRATGSLLYNGHNAHGAIDLVLAEGAFDVFATKIAFDSDHGLREAAICGTFGKHLSDGEGGQFDQLERLRQGGLKRVTFLWDGEERAIDDAIDAALELRKRRLITRLAMLPKGKDPNEVPPSVVREAFWSAKTIDPMTATRLKLRRRLVA